MNSHLTDEQIANAFTKKHGGPNPYYECKECGEVVPGLRAYLEAHIVANHGAILAAAPAGEGEPDAKHQPCGCVLCTCEDEEQCHGCGAKFCDTHALHSATRQALRRLLEIEEERIANGIFKPNAEAMRRIEKARAMLAAAPAVPVPPATCTRCGGNGKDLATQGSAWPFPCPTCNGTGKAAVPPADGECWERGLPDSIDRAMAYEKVAVPPADGGDLIPGEAYRHPGMVCGRCGCADLLYEGTPPVAGTREPVAPEESVDLDPRRALDYARQMKTYCEAFNDRNWGNEMLFGSVDTQNLATALDNLTECAAMLINMADRVATPPAGVQGDGVTSYLEFVESVQRVFTSPAVEVPGGAESTAVMQQALDAMEVADEHFSARDIRSTRLVEAIAAMRSILAPSTSTSTSAGATSPASADQENERG